MSTDERAVLACEACAKVAAGGPLRAELLNRVQVFRHICDDCVAQLTGREGPSARASKPARRS